MRLSLITFCRRTQCRAPLFLGMAGSLVALLGLPLPVSADASERLAAPDGDFSLTKSMALLLVLLLMRLLAGAVARLSGDPLRAAVLALTTLRRPEAYILLHALAQSEREAVRLAVIDALPGDAASQTLLEKLGAKDPSPHVRAAAKAVIASQ